MYHAELAPLQNAAFDNEQLELLMDGETPSAGPPRQISLSRKLKVSIGAGVVLLLLGVAARLMKPGLSMDAKPLQKIIQADDDSYWSSWVSDSDDEMQGLSEDFSLDGENDVLVYLSGLKDHTGEKEERREWLREKMKKVKSIKTVKALHMYYRIAGKADLFGGPYVDVAEGERARLVIEWGLHKYDGDDWTHYMNEEKATKKPPEGTEAGVGTTASLVTQVYPPDEKFVILILAWLPIGKYPWAGPGGVGAAHTHGQATCNFKFLNAVEGAGNTFYDLSGGNSTITDMFQDGLPHKGGCKDHDYRPILVNPKVGRQFIESKDLMGDTSGYIQDDLGAHSIDNMNTEEIVYSIHVYYPPYAAAWAFHENKDNNPKGSGCQHRTQDSKTGKRNCKMTYSPTCSTTSMKKYLDEAAAWKEQHGEEHPVKWYHEMCKHVEDYEWLHDQCMNHLSDLLEYAQDDVNDPTLEG